MKKNIIALAALAVLGTSTMNAETHARMSHHDDVYMHHTDRGYDRPGHHGRPERVVIVEEPAPMPHRVVRAMPAPAPAPVVVEARPSKVATGVVAGAVIGGLIAAACH